MAGIRKICSFLRGSRLIFQIYTLNLLITAAATGMFAIYIYYNTFSSTKRQLFETSRRNLQQVVDGMEAVFKRIETQSASLSMNEIFRKGCSGFDTKTPNMIYEDYLKLDKLCAELENVDNLYDISIIFEKRHKMMNNRNRFYYDDMGLFDVITEDSFWLWGYGGISGNPLYGIRMQTEDHENVLLLFGIRERVYQEWLAGLRFYGEGKEFIGRMDLSLLDNGIWNAEDHIWEKEIMDRLDGIRAGQGDFFLTHESEKYFVLYGFVPKNPFFVASAFPASAIERDAENSVQGMFFILIPILLLVFLASYIASVHLTGHLRRLSWEMNQIYPAENQQIMKKKGWDEIELLESSFHQMQKRMNRAMEEVREAEKKQRIAELSLLQGQINPHFLYNTLDSINWLAIEMNAPKISFIVKNMSDYFRMGLNSGEQISTLRQEICHILSYFNIQKFRFEDKIHLYIDVPKELMETPMIVLSLQPIVENAILHGILEEEGRNGAISVSAEAVEENVFIYIADDGVGMDEEAVSILNRRVKGADNTETGSGGFGLYNVNQRVRYFFGDEYGLDIVSKRGEGTTCILTVPARMEKNE